MGQYIGCKILGFKILKVLKTQGEEEEEEKVIGFKILKVLKTQGGEEEEEEEEEKVRRICVFFKKEIL